MQVNPSQSFIMANTVVVDLQNEVVNLRKTLDTITQTMETITNQLQNLSQVETQSKVEKFDTFIQKELIVYFGATTSANLVKLLQHCRSIDNFQPFTAAYHWKSIYGDAKKRQLLKLLSATYRIKYLNPVKHPGVAALKSEVKYAKECPECGEMAHAFYNRLIAEGVAK